MDTNSPFQFQKRSQFFISAHNETLAVAAMRIGDPVFRASESRADTQPQLQPDLLRLSAMISQVLLTPAIATFLHPRGSLVSMTSETLVNSRRRRSFAMKMPCNDARVLFPFGLDLPVGLGLADEPFPAALLRLFP